MPILLTAEYFILKNTHNNYSLNGSGRILFWNISIELIYYLPHCLELFVFSFCYNDSCKGSSIFRHNVPIYYLHARLIDENKLQYLGKSTVIRSQSLHLFFSDRELFAHASRRNQFNLNAISRCATRKLREVNWALGQVGAVRFWTLWIQFRRPRREIFDWNLIRGFALHIGI